VAGRPQVAGGLQQEPLLPWRWDALRGFHALFVRLVGGGVTGWQDLARDNFKMDWNIDRAEKNGNVAADG